MLTLVSSNSKYDSVMRKESVFTAQEKNGYKLFKTNCAECHTEPLFTNLKFENNGLTLDTTLNDTGRMKITHNQKDSLRFKIPSLRNIQFSYPYMHEKKKKKLSEVLTHYTTGVQKSTTLSQKLQKNIVLSSNERVDMIAFLLTLTDRTFLFNNDYSFPRTIFFPEKKE
jgi:cytochrome c peroxidase